jgi:ribosomal protein L6P/L9E
MRHNIEIEGSYKEDITRIQAKIREYRWIKKEEKKEGGAEEKKE